MGGLSANAVDEIRLSPSVIYFDKIQKIKEIASLLTLQKEITVGSRYRRRYRRVTLRGCKWWFGRGGSDPNLSDFIGYTSASLNCDSAQFIAVHFDLISKNTLFFEVHTPLDSALKVF